MVYKRIDPPKMFFNHLDNVIPLLRNRKLSVKHDNSIVAKNSKKSLKIYHYDSTSS